MRVSGEPKLGFRGAVLCLTVLGREQIKRNENDGQLWIPVPVTVSQKLWVHYTAYFSEAVTGTGIHILPSFFLLLIYSLPRTGRQQTAPLNPTLGSPLPLKHCGYYSKLV